MAPATQVANIRGVTWVQVPGPPWHTESISSSSLSCCYSGGLLLPEWGCWSLSPSSPLCACHSIVCHLSHLGIPSPPNCQLNNSCLYPVYRKHSERSKPTNLTSGYRSKWKWSLWIQHPIPNEDEGQEPAAWACWCAFDPWSPWGGGGEREATPQSCPLSSTWMLWCVCPCTMHIQNNNKKCQSNICNSLSLFTIDKAMKTT